MIEKRAVWDLPTRIFHWSLAGSVMLSMLIVYGTKYHALHIVAGSTAFALLIGRVVWGLVGTRYVRFSAFVKSIDEAKAEFAALREDRHLHSVGHPVVAGWVMLFLIFCGLCACGSGVWLSLCEEQNQKQTALFVHEIFSNTVLATAFIHVQGVLLHWLLHRDGIVLGMMDGRRPAEPHEQIGLLSMPQKIVAFLWFAGCLAAALVALKFVYPISGS